MAIVTPCLSRCISTFNASRELPSSVEDSLVLWLNKVSEAVCNYSKEEMTGLLLEPDPFQRRRNKVKLLDSPETSIPPVNQLGAGITDGQCLAALLLHYCQDSVKCSGINCCDAMSTQKQSQENHTQETQCHLLRPSAVVTYKYAQCKP